MEGNLEAHTVDETQPELIDGSSQWSDGRKGSPLVTHVFDPDVMSPPDLNRQVPILVFPPDAGSGPQQPAPDVNDPHRTSTASAGWQCSFMADRMPKSMSDRMSEFVTDIMSEVLSDRLSASMSDRMSESMSNIMSDFTSDRLYFD